MNCLFLYNPNSGKGRVAKKVPYIRKKLESRYERVDIVQTESAQDMETRARAAVGNYDTLLFSGGDGTFNNVLQGIGDSGMQLGYIPGGTANDVARSLGIPRNVKGALRTVLSGRSQPVDCMRINEAHYAMYIAAAGAFTAITYQTPQKKKRAFGRVAYAIRGLKKNMNLQIFPVDCVCGGKSVTAHGVLVLVMNGRSVAGLPINKQASMKDGALEVAVIKQVQKPNVFQRIGKYFSIAAVFLFGARVRKRDIEFLHGESVTFRTSDDVVWDFDGEEGISGSVKIEVLRGRVNLFVPKKKKI